jgi:hypothetical protein
MRAFPTFLLSLLCAVSALGGPANLRPERAGTEKTIAYALASAGRLSALTAAKLEDAERTRRMRVETNLLYDLLQKYRAELSAVGRYESELSRLVRVRRAISSADASARRGNARDAAKSLESIRGECRSGREALETALKWAELAP